MASSEYLAALELAAEIYGTDVLELERVLTEVGAPYTAESVYNAWLNTGSIGNNGLHVRETASGKTMFYYADSSGTVSQTSTLVTEPNSNATVTKKVSYPVNTSVETPAPTSRVSFKGGMREAGKFVLGEVVPAIAAAGVGITLGKTIDQRLYDANPDFWDAHNMSSLNPETWNDITSDYDGFAGTLFNFVFGLEGDKTQAYIDEDAMAYLAWWMNTKEVFKNDLTIEEYNPSSGYELPSDVVAGLNMPLMLSSKYIRWDGYDYNVVGNGTVYSSMFDYHNGSGDRRLQYPIFASDAPFTVGSQSVSPVTIAGKTYYRAGGGASARYSNSAWRSIGAINTYSVITNNGFNDIDFVKLVFGNEVIQGKYPGIGNQDGATLPNTANWNDLASTKSSLQQQYPDLWNNAKHYDLVNPDGTTTGRTYIPINIPDADNYVDVTPTSGIESQSKPYVDTETGGNITTLITSLITALTSSTPTGSGDSPVVPAPTGSASSLWAVYNPTQAQLDSFGSWLWSSNLVEQIKKLFNDPMQAVIGVHKVFATPITGASQNIKCGYIDSGIPSAVVTNQYTTINCGSVKLKEYFGNIFDYSPYTKIQLYLPFIGIVDLDVADVMRSTITVKYHVDVLTGACLADVIVNRDAAGGVLYQYAGSAIVTYPVSAGNYMSMLAGVLSVAGGIAGTVLSGGSLAPALIGGAVGASHLHTDVKHSGGFSGCAGAMGSKKPYLIISRPQIAMADNYQHYTGLPANSRVTLGNCDGYVKVKSVYIGNITRATEEEKNMIESQLKTGVLV